MTKQRNLGTRVASAAIGALSIIGGVFLTNHYTGFLDGGTGQGGSSNGSSSGNGSSGSGATTAGKTGSATGDAFQYQFGVIQLKVTEKNGKITAVDLVQATANNGREAAFPYLVKYAIASQGSSFANLSGATYTTDTFKQALDSAIAKLG
jgi:uncharacterized protein with FMN-binding domain